MRAETNQDAEFIGYISPGEEMDNTEGPICADGGYGGGFRSETGVVGWTSEGEEDTYWLVRSNKKQRSQGHQKRREVYHLLPASALTNVRGVKRPDQKTWILQ